MIFLVILYPTPSLLRNDKKNDCGSHRGLFCSVLDEKMSLTSKRKKVKILVHCLDAYSCVIKNLKQKQIKEKTALSSARTKFVRSSTSPVGTLVKHHSSQRNVALPTPLVRKFVTPKVSDYSNKLRLGLGRCHLEQRAYCLNVNWQIQVGTMGHFLILGLGVLFVFFVFLILLLFICLFLFIFLLQKG